MAKASDSQTLEDRIAQLEAENAALKARFGAETINAEHARFYNGAFVTHGSGLYRVIGRSVDADRGVVYNLLPVTGGSVLHQIPEGTTVRLEEFPFSDPRARSSAVPMKVRSVKDVVLGEDGVFDVPEDDLEPFHEHDTVAALSGVAEAKARGTMVDEISVGEGQSIAVTPEPPTEQAPAAE